VKFVGAIPISSPTYQSTGTNKSILYCIGRIYLNKNYNIIKMTNLVIPSIGSLRHHRPSGLSWLPVNI